MANNLTGTKYADHLRGCVDLSKEVAERLGLHDDAARQACFATVVIGADRHNIFMEPFTPEIREAIQQPEPKPPVRHDVVGQNLGALPDATPEQSESATRGALLAGINSARELLKMTPVQLNEYIKAKLKVDRGLGSLDVEELALLTEKLSKRIDAEKQKQSGSPLKDHLMEREAEKATSQDDLEDWP